MSPVFLVILSPEKKKRISKTMYAVGKGWWLPPDNKTNSLKQVVRKTGLKQTKHIPVEWIKQNCAAGRVKQWRFQAQLSKLEHLLLHVPQGPCASILPEYLDTAGSLQIKLF